MQENIAMMTPVDVQSIKQEIKEKNKLLMQKKLSDEHKNILSQITKQLFLNFSSTFITSGDA